VSTHPTFVDDGRPGTFGNGTLWDIYPEMTAPIRAASDHAAIWVDLDL